MPALLAQLSGDCKHRDVRFESANCCGALFPDLGAPLHDEPIAASLALKIVRGGRIKADANLLVP